MHPFRNFALRIFNNDYFFKVPCCYTGIEKNKSLFYDNKYYKIKEFESKRKSN